MDGSPKQYMWNNDS